MRGSQASYVGMTLARVLRTRRTSKQAESGRKPTIAIIYSGVFGVSSARKTKGWSEWLQERRGASAAY